MKLFYDDVKTHLLSLIVFLTASGMFCQQSTLETFKLEDVSLKEGPFRNAMLVDLGYILEFNPDKLFAPFLREAGLNPKEESYPNWENTGLDGHIGGHYLTALSQMYASAGSEKADSLLTYSLNELERVQEANANGYIGGVPGSKKLWGEIANGNIDAASFSLNGKWVPLYNIHKTFAGLRDAYEISGKIQAKEMLIKLTDWMLEVTRDLSEEQIQELLVSEHGGLNEIFADVARITGEEKYIELAYKFSHKKFLEPLVSNNDNLNGMHANTQIPKVIGFETIAGIAGDEDYHDAAKFFWETVVNNRTVAIGGNSVREHFHPASDFSPMVTDVQGPETCNTYNMLKLSKRLFQAEGMEKYIDYYEQGLYNHILSSQHPEKGGFVYFTPMRPGHYRVYSQPETSFWCCVGSGLENHGKYNELIYAHRGNELYVNLYIPSTLNWEEKGLTLDQETRFPNEESVVFTVQLKTEQALSLKLRYPDWVRENEFQVSVNGEPVIISSSPGTYVSLERTWKDGDKMEVKLPMHISAERLPDGSNYEALKYGPIVLAAKTGNEDLQGLFADASRGGHIAHGKTIPLAEMPMFVTNDSSIEPYIKKVSGKELTFSASEVIPSEEYKDLEFIPFYELHDARYAIYLPVETPDGAAQIQKELEEREREEKKLESLTIDLVSPGEQQPESDHFIRSERSTIGVHRDRHWRDAEGWFSYELKDENLEAKRLRITYFGEDRDRIFKILINGNVIAEEQLDGSKGNTFYEVDYHIPQSMVKNGNGTLIVKFEAASGSKTAGIYGVRLLKEEQN